MRLNVVYVIALFHSATEFSFVSVRLMIQLYAFAIHAKAIFVSTCTPLLCDHGDVFFFLSRKTVGRKFNLRKRTGRIYIFLRAIIYLAGRVSDNACTVCELRPLPRHDTSYLGVLLIDNARVIDSAKARASEMPAFITHSQRFLYICKR